MNDDVSGQSKSFAASLALGETAKNRKMSGRAAKYLDEQIALSRLQREHLQHTRALHAENLKLQGKVLRSQYRQLRGQHLHDRMRTVYQSVISLVALAVLSIIVYAVINAARDQSVVVNQFQVPPGFDVIGNSGTVVASDFLDRLQTLQMATRSQQSSRSVQGAWSNNIRLQVPDVHVTIGDIRRNLNAWLGHEIQISGDVVRQGNQIAFTVRGTGFVARTFTGAPNALMTLLTSAAEYVYGQAEPYNFANYLEEHGRDADAISLVHGVFPTAKPKDRPWLLNAWGNALADLNHNRAAAGKYREALRFDPQFWIAYANLENAQIQLGQQQAAYETGVSMEQHADRGSWFGAKVPGLYYSNLDQLQMDLPAVHRELVADETAHGGEGTLTTQEAPLDAEMLARMHADRRANFILQTSPGAGSDHYVVAATHYVRGLMALDYENYSLAASEFTAAEAMISAYPGLRGNFNSPPICYQGLADELAGQPDLADAAITEGGRFVDCYRFKGDIADFQGHWNQAQKAYAAAVALAPSLPQAYESWGTALMRHADYRAAILKFQAAHERGPHWCDPLERWGEALAAEGNYRAAVRKYAAAAHYTPRWSVLELHWGEALSKLGRHATALAHYRSALGSEDLTVAEQTMLTTLVNHGR